MIRHRYNFGCRWGILGLIVAIASGVGCTDCPKFEPLLRNPQTVLSDTNVPYDDTIPSGVLGLQLLTCKGNLIVADIRGFECSRKSLVRNIRRMKSDDPKGSKCIIFNLRVTNQRDTSLQHMAKAIYMVRKAIKESGHAESVILHVSIPGLDTGSYIGPG